MTNRPIAVLGTGLVTSVGLSSAASCAAIRAKVSNPIETRYIDADGGWIMAHQVRMGEGWGGRTKLVKMAGTAIRDCMRATQIEDWSNIPLLLCVAEPERPGRLDGLDVALLADVQFEVGVDFAVTSSIIPEGRASVASALRKARAMMTSPSAQLVVVAATDSLLTWQTLSSYERADRLLTPRNSNGFMAGEGACALLLGSAPIGNQLLVCGVGTAKEASPIDMEKPLRGDGLTNAVRQALNEADCELHDLDFRITDVSGEQYYFKEAALALSRILRTHKETFELWQPSECIGETGAVAGLSLIAVAEAACRKAYAPGRGILCHAANDSGQRAAIVLRYTES